MFKSKSLGKEMKQNTIFSSHLNKLEFDQDTRWTFWPTEKKIWNLT